MKYFNSVWFYLYSLLAIVFLIVAIAIWQSSQRPSLFESEKMDEGSSVSVQDQYLDNNEASHSTPTTRPKPENIDPDSYPAPAKKLYKMLHDSEFQPRVSPTELDKRVEALEQTLSELNRQLQDQGVSIPTQEKPVATEAIAEKSGPVSAVTRERLNAIKEHLEQK